MKKCIMITGLYTPGSGLTNVMHNLIRHLSDSFQIVCLGFDADKKDNEIAKSEIAGADLYVFPVNGIANLIQIGNDHLEGYIDLYKPSCIITTGAIMFNRYLLVILQKYRSSLNIVSYISVEGKLADVNFLKYIRLIDFCVFYTAVTYNCFNKLLLENPMPDNGFGAVRSACIGHGVDKNSFYPLPAENERERRTAARKLVYHNYAVNEDSFIVLNVNRPSQRKRIDAAIEGFKQFSADKENVFLHLHIGANTGPVLTKHINFVEEAGLKNKVIITPDPGDDRVKPVNWLNTVYNACNVGISTSKGEGWGLSLFEHAATRAAILAPAHTSFQENWENAALLMPCSEKDFVFYEHADMYSVSPEEVCKGLNSLYFDKNLLDKVSLDCFNRALESKYDWANIGEQFRQIVMNL
jgi:D-inositol-3-phosphate glycosyltransferase